MPIVNYQQVRREECTPDCYMNYLSKDYDLKQVRGFLNKTTRKTAFELQLTRVSEYAKAIYTFETAFANESCNRDKKVTKQYKQVSFSYSADSVTYRGDKRDLQNKITTVGYSINGTLRMKDLKDAHVMLEREHKALISLFQSPTVDVDYSYLYLLKNPDAPYQNEDVSARARVIRDLNELSGGNYLNSYIGNAVTRKQRIYRAEPAFLEYLRTEVNGEMNVLEYLSRTLNQQLFVNELYQIVSDGWFSKAIVSALIFAAFKLQGVTRYGSDKKPTPRGYANGTYEPTQAMDKIRLFTDSPGPKGKGIGIWKVGELLKDGNFFRAAPTLVIKKAPKGTKGNQLKLYSAEEKKPPVPLRNEDLAMLFDVGPNGVVRNVGTDLIARIFFVVHGLREAAIAKKFYSKVGAGESA